MLHSADDGNYILNVRIDHRNQGYRLSEPVTTSEECSRGDHNRFSVMSLCPSSSHQLVAAAIAFRRARRKFPKDFGLKSAVERAPEGAEVRPSERDSLFVRDTIAR